MIQLWGPGFFFDRKRDPRLAAPGFADSPGRGCSKGRGRPKGVRLEQGGQGAPGRRGDPAGGAAGGLVGVVPGAGVRQGLVVDVGGAWGPKNFSLWWKKKKTAQRPHKQRGLPAPGLHPGGFCRARAPCSQGSWAPAGGPRFSRAKGPALNGGWVGAARDCASAGFFPLASRKTLEAEGVWRRGEEGGGGGRRNRLFRSFPGRAKKARGGPGETYKNQPSWRNGTFPRPGRPQRGAFPEWDGKAGLG